MSHSYDDNDLLEELRKATSTAITDASRETASKSVEEDTKSPQSFDELLKGIEGLITEGNTLAARLLDCRKLSEKAGLADQTQLQGLWDNFTKLLWNSKTIAISGKTLADDFVNNMIELLQDPNFSAEEKVRELEGWDVIAMKRGEVATQQPGAFEAFVEVLQRYRNDIDKETTKNETSAQKELAKLLAKISNLNKQIDDIATTIMGPISRFLELGGAFLSRLITSPDAAFRMLLRAVADGVKELTKFKPQLEAAKKKRQELETERDTLKERVRAIEIQQAKLGDASTLSASLGSIGDDIKAFSGRLSQFVDIFSRLHNVKSEVAQLLLTRPITNPVLVAKLSLVEGLVRADARVLGVYGSASISQV